jgi:hypothetical protein
MTIKEKQKEEVEKQIKSIAQNIANSTKKMNESENEFELRKEHAESMIRGLCIMYKIAYSQ